jgi:hypothetical protein
MSEPEMLWQRAVARAAEDRFYLAASLRAFQSAQAMSDAQMAQMLGCPLADLARLALCRCPDTHSPRFGSEVAHIAARFGIKTEALAQIIRQVSFMQAMQTTTHLSVTQAVMPVVLAARDRDETEEEEGEEQ